MRPAPTGDAGIYVHVPFCRRRCPYCDFAVVVSARPPHEEYLDALFAEWEARRAEIEGRRVRTLYFGGGTPSAWGAEPTARLVRRVLADGARPDEITVEVNPEDATPELLGDLALAGVGRVSFGVQSFDPATLAVLGRHHDARRAAAAVRTAARVGIPAVSVDLVYAVPGEPPDRIERDLDHVLALGVAHVSAYELTYEPRTSFGVRVESGRMTPEHEDAVLAAGRRIRDRLHAAGLERYEVSNYARPGAESRHNGGYWRGDEYLGLGVGAHSLRLDADGVHRRANTRSIRNYLAAPTEPDWTERLEASTHLAELVMLGVRTAAGVDFAAASDRFGEPMVAPFEGLARAWDQRGLGRLDGRVYRPGPDSLDVADALGGEAIRLADPGAVW